MLLCEIFDEDFDQGNLIDRLRSAMMDVLTPLAAQGIPYITVGAVIDELRKLRSGISVDRSLVMQVLDPDQVKMVTKIEGDRIYFKPPVSDDRKVGADQQEKDAEKVSNTAAQQAQKNLSS